MDIGMERGRVRMVLEIPEEPDNQAKLIILFT
jgi:hypothetical protein